MAFLTFVSRSATLAGTSPPGPFPPPRDTRRGPYRRVDQPRGDRDRRLREQAQGEQDGGRRYAAAGQPRPQQVAPPRDPRADRAERPPELPRHRLVREPLDVAEHHRGTILLREPAETPVEGRVQLVALQAVVVVHPGHLRVQGRRNLPPRGGPARLECDATGDAVEPRADRPPLPNRAGLADQQQEGRLEGVLRRVR